MEKLNFKKAYTRKVLTIEQWTNVFRSMAENENEFEILWLDGTDEWVIAFECELFEDGFETEKQAMNRLEEMRADVLRVKELKVKCLNCGYEQKIHTIYNDKELGKHTICYKCRSSFDIL